jgi:hypothetical protein
MDKEYSILIQQLDEKVQQLADFLTSGRAKDIEEYRAVCGEVKGLLIARGNILDLQQRTEQHDE